MKLPQQEIITELNEKLPGLDLEARISLIAQVEGNIVFSTSFGIEDQVLTHFIAKNANISLFTLDTGRLFTETYEVWEQTLNTYEIEIRSFAPDGLDLTQLIQKQGPNGFYRGIDQRLACCHVRKIKPLEQALKGADLWITGLRAAQSNHRAALHWADYDSNQQLIKVNPLVDVTQKELLSWVNTHQIPINKLHEQGFPSIGCAPCTQAVPEGADPRSGRWWWEQSHKECGLHLNSHS